MARVLVVAAFCAMFTVDTAPVRADSPEPFEQKYIDLLKSKGLGCSPAVPCKTTGADQDLLLLGHEICDELRTGRSEEGLIDHPPGGVTLSRYQAGLLVGISEAAFCPGVSAPAPQPA